MTVPENYCGLFLSHTLLRGLLTLIELPAVAEHGLHIVAAEAAEIILLREVDEDIGVAGIGNCAEVAGLSRNVIAAAEEIRSGE